MEQVVRSDWSPDATYEGGHVDCDGKHISRSKPEIGSTGGNVGEKSVKDELPPAVIQGYGNATRSRTGRLYGRSGGGRGGGHGQGGSTTHYYYYVLVSRSRVPVATDLLVSVDVTARH